jgi:glycosyltransferase involved in cell wall biosynthesis
VCYKQRKMQHPERPTLLFLAPLTPAASGNGLAMRAGAQLEALNGFYDVRAIVIPVAGGTLDSAWVEQRASLVAYVTPDDPAELRSGAARLVGEARWRERFQRAEPMPHPVRYASPALAAPVVAAAGGIRGARVHALRAYLAPLAVAVAELVNAPWATLDLDDDDEHRLEAAGRHEEQSAYARILETFGSEFAWVSLASPEDAERVAARHGLRTIVVPNSVTLRADRGGRPRGRGRQRSLLFVGNLRYGPNAEAAELLAREILPRVRSLAGEPVGVELVGRYEPGGPVAALAELDAIELRGHVEDLADAYAGADVAAIPLTQGSGTRIKLLEAFAAGVPVVTTAVGAAGLGAEHGRHLLIAEGAPALAEAIARLLADDELAAGLAREARGLVEERFSAAVVGRQLREAMLPLENVSGDQPALDEV